MMYADIIEQLQLEVDIRRRSQGHKQPRWTMVQ
jgi:hypothetical protein